MHSLSFVCTPNTTTGSVEVAMLIDGTNLYNGLLDVSGFLFAGHLNGVSYDLYTCSCGDSGCAGFHVPLEQTRDAHTVRWSIQDTKLAKVLGGNTATFDALQFDAACAELRAQLQAYEAQGLHADYLMGDAADEDEDRRVPMTLAQLESHQAPYFAGQVALFEVQRAAADPTDPAPVRMTYNAYDAEGQRIASPSFFEVPSVQAASILFNLGNSLSPNQHNRADLLPLATGIIRDFHHTNDAEAANRAFAPLRQFLQEDGVDTPSRALFLTDAQGGFVAFPF